MVMARSGINAKSKVPKVQLSKSLNLYSTSDFFFTTFLVHVTPVMISPKRTHVANVAIHMQVSN